MLSGVLGQNPVPSAMLGLLAKTSGLHMGAGEGRSWLGSQP